MPAFKLSTALKKKAHPWRHASQRIKKIKPNGSTITWADFLERQRYNLKLSDPSRGWSERKPNFDEALMARWDAIHARRNDGDLFRSLDVLGQATILSHFIESQPGVWLIDDFFGMCLHDIFQAQGTPHNLTRFLDLMRGLSEVREHLTQSAPHSTQRHTFSKVEARIALLLRRELCTISDADYAYITAHARTQYGVGDEGFDLFLALSFPEETPWGNAAVDRLIAHEIAPPIPPIYCAMTTVFALDTGA